MYIPKRYGQSKTENCKFCSKMATTKNKQGLSTCIDHKYKEFEEIKCTCGSWLELKSGKFGSYFNCINCGNINFNKGMEIKEMTKNKELKLQQKEQSSSEKNKEKKQVKAQVHPKKNEDRFILDSGKYDNFDYGID